MMDQEQKRAISAIRFLVADSVQRANSGHPGMAIGAAPMAYALWNKMKHNPKDPQWADRDRFVLSAGHVSMLQYALLHLYGYDLPMEEIKNFRQWGSRAPGHPEYGVTAGVEATSGPLGQGVAVAVGMAMAQAHLAAVFNRPGYPVVDHYTYVLTGDGCLMEGVAAEAVSMAGTMGLDKLILLYDRNRITIEGSTDLAFDEDVGARFAACGWQVLTVADGEDVDAVSAAIDAAKADNRHPSIIISHSRIGHGTAKEGLPSAHGEPLGEENVAKMRQDYGWSEEPFTVPADVQAHYAAKLPALAQAQQDWEAMFAAYAKEYPDLAEKWEQWHQPADVSALVNDAALWQFEKEKMATRAASGEVLTRLYQRLPNLFGGSADLAPSNKTYVKGQGDFSKTDYSGCNVHFGIREFAMAAAGSGIALHGGLQPYCATFFVFSDYLKPAMRVAALMKLKVLYILTHDSIGVGEDGPTHQPIEQLAALRATPNVTVFRPADARETVAGYLAALENNGPTALVLSRQDLPVLPQTGVQAMKGGYILREAKKETPDVILMATGSEVSLALQAADALDQMGMAARVVSMPSMELFEKQPKEYRESVLPAAIRARVAVEAASSFGWYKYVGLDGAVVSRDDFGASAKSAVLFEKFGITVEAVVDAAMGVIR